MCPKRYSDFKKGVSLSLVCRLNLEIGIYLLPNHLVLI